MEIDSSERAQVRRQKAVELAISEIAAYKASTIPTGYSNKLLESAKAIEAFIRDGVIPS